MAEMLSAIILNALIFDVDICIENKKTPLWSNLIGDKAASTQAMAQRKTGNDLSPAASFTYMV